MSHSQNAVMIEGDRKRKSKAQYQRLSLKKKIDIITAYENGEKNKVLAEKYGVVHGTITRIIANKEKYWQELKKVQSFNGNTNSTRVTGCLDSAFEKAVYFWFVQKRNLGEPVSGPMIREKALHFQELINGKTDFQASEGWLSKFKDRHGIRCLSMKGDRLSANNEEEATKFCEWFSNYLRNDNYNLENVYKAEETGLNWKSLPEKTLVNKDEFSVDEYKVNKERVTILTCANASGTHKVPLLVIGKAMKPRCFKDKQNLPVIYDSQRNAWMVRDIFFKWYRNVFLPNIKGKKPGTDERFILLLDNAPSHPPLEELNSIDSQCTVIYVPPDVICIVQPMDQGYSSALKKLYKKALLRELLAHDLHDEPNTDEFKKTWSLYDCCDLLADCWKSLNEVVLKYSWKNILRINSTDDLLRANAIKSESENSESMSDLVPTLNNIPDNKLYVFQDVEEWIKEEPNSPVFQVLDDDEIANMFNDSNITIEKHDPFQEDKDNSNDDDDDDVPDSTIPLSSVLQAAKLLCRWSKTRKELNAEDCAACYKIKKLVVDLKLSNGCIDSMESS